MSKSKVRKAAIEVLGARIRKKPASSHGPQLEKKERERKVRVGVRAKKDFVGITFKKKF